MIDAYEHFLKLLADTKNANIVYRYLENIIKPPFDYSDLLRWQLAQGLSALDKFMHDIVRIGMIEIWKGNRPLTAKYNSFPITSSFVSEIKANPSMEIDAFERHIMQAHAIKSFQDPDKIADALSLVWNESHKWDRIAAQMSTTSNSAKSQLKTIVVRRNQIVHEGDYDGFSGARQLILEQDVIDALLFIQQVGDAVYKLIK